MIAMMGIPKQNDAHIDLLYNKYNDNNFDHWKCAGPIFVTKLLLRIKNGLVQ